MRTFLALAWLALGIGIVVSSFVDLGQSHWRISWFAVGLTATVLAWVCSAILQFRNGGRSVFGAAIAALFVLYFVYLFVISPPDTVNAYSLLGSAVILLGVATIGTLAKSQADVPKAKQ